MERLVEGWSKRPDALAPGKQARAPGPCTWTGLVGAVAAGGGRAVALDRAQRPPRIAGRMTPSIRFRLNSRVIGSRVTAWDRHIIGITWARAATSADGNSAR